MVLAPDARPDDPITAFGTAGVSPLPLYRGGG
jgi:hypothetical protein